MRKRMYIYVCVCVRERERERDWVTLLYSRKLIGHCKPAIREKIKIIIYKKIRPIRLLAPPGWEGMFHLLRYLQDLASYLTAEKMY